MIQARSAILLGKYTGYGHPMSNRALSSSSTGPSPKYFLSDVKKRIGRCVSFGLPVTGALEAARISRHIGEDWKSLVLAVDGYDIRNGLEEKVRWGEMDAMGHVNNVAYLRFAEMSRIHWFRTLSKNVPRQHKGEWGQLLGPQGTFGLILAEVSIKYKMPLRFPCIFSLHHRLASPPALDETEDDGKLAKAFRFDCTMLSHSIQRPAATFRETLFLYDYRAQSTTALPQWIRKFFQEQWLQQEEQAAVATGRRAEIETDVRGLEMGSWDREGAVEDFGQTL
ncbi:hypothetical protein MMC25_008103 [Agyrium rufum]|nr:hypothetical protein [Agyrium rufum]